MKPRDRALDQPLFHIGRTSEQDYLQKSRCPRGKRLTMVRMICGMCCVDSQWCLLCRNSIEIYRARVFFPTRTLIAVFMLTDSTKSQFYNLRPILTSYKNCFLYFFVFVVCRLCTSKQSLGYLLLNLARWVLVEVFVRDWHKTKIWLESFC